MLFDSDAVKALREQSQTVAEAALAHHYGEADSPEGWLCDREFRTTYKQAFDAAARDVGPTRALRKAHRSAGGCAKRVAEVNARRSARMHAVHSSGVEFPQASFDVIVGRGARRVAVSAIDELLG